MGNSSMAEVTADQQVLMAPVPVGQSERKTGEAFDDWK
jgi:hypothetical protein